MKRKITIFCMFIMMLISSLPVMAAENEKLISTANIQHDPRIAPLIENGLIAAKTLYKCEICYAEGRAVCNGERILKPDTYFHGNCAYLVYESTGRFESDFCSHTYNLPLTEHPCVQTHMGTGCQYLGTHVTCPFR